MYISQVSGERLQDHWSSGLIFAPNIDCGYNLEPPSRGGSNCTNNLCFEQKEEKYHKFLTENYQVLQLTKK